jgi:hypothetical protein
MSDQVIPVIDTGTNSSPHLLQIKNAKDASSINFLPANSFIDLAKGLLQNEEVASAISYHTSHVDNMKYDPSVHYPISDVVHNYLSNVFPAAYR